MNRRSRNSSIDDTRSEDDGYNSWSDSDDDNEVHEDYLYLTTKEAMSKRVGLEEKANIFSTSPSSSSWPWNKFGLLRRRKQNERFQPKEKTRTLVSVTPSHRKDEDHDDSSSSSSPSSSSSSSSISTESNSSIEHYRRKIQDEKYKSLMKKSPWSFLRFQMKCDYLLRQFFGSRKSSICFIVSILIWLVVQLYVLDHHRFSTRTHHSPPRFGLWEQAALLQAQREEEARTVLGPGGKPIRYNHRHRRHPHEDDDSSGSSVETPVDHTAKVDKIPKGCIPKSWHSYSFPNCNDIHEIDLTVALHLQKQSSRIIPAPLGDDQDVLRKDFSFHDTQQARQMGFMGSGLWRQVWKVNPREEDMVQYRSSYQSSIGSSFETNEKDSYYTPAVLKMMKREHPVDERNFDRHRRDALVMERLTASSSIPAIYGFCGNTVLSEYAGKTLHDVLFQEYIRHTHNHTQETMNQDDMDRLSPRTPKGRIRLALGVLQGIAALHEIDGGPIIHADIQIDQYLFEDRTNRILLNDFNRCRFVPRRNETGNLCKVKIPSAPGGHRSPEEYDLLPLDEKIDIFSVGHVLYAILTGTLPWANLDRADIQRNVRLGNRPDIDDSRRIPGTSDAILASIIDNMYETNPEDRRSARDVINELQLLLL